MRQQNDIPNQDRQFVIGFTQPVHGFDGKWWTNQAVADSEGTLSNDMLQLYSDKDLKDLAFSADGSIKTEKYRRPMDSKAAERQGGYPSEEYFGVHRAYLILEYRKALKQHQFALPS